MTSAFICDAVRTPIGRFGGSLSSIRTDDLASIPLAELVRRHPQIDWKSVDDVILGCTNQSGEDNRNVARMALLLAGIPETVPGVTVNRLCASGLDAVGIAARKIQTFEAELVIAGGVESMSRAPQVIAKATTAFSRHAEIYDTTLGWRFVNRKLREEYGVDEMAETAENLAEMFAVARDDQDRFAHWSQVKAEQAQREGQLADEIVSVSVPQRKGDPIQVSQDEHPRLSSIEQLAKLRTPFRENGTVTAGNASGINDGAGALLIASEAAISKYELTPMARIHGTAVSGVAPRIMGIGPVSATQRLLSRYSLTLDEFDLFELNEAFAVQVLACTRQLGLSDEDPRLNRQGGAIALGHPLGMSGARLAITAAHQMKRDSLRRALCTMCVGVGQGIAMMLEGC